jgi:FMN phosphatase YigB (HAD superfamily)
MNYMDIRPKTIFCDIDGTLVKHDPPSLTSKSDYKMELLEGTIEKLLEWDKKGYNIILTTGRKESLRKVTEHQLTESGIFYDYLIMGIGGGTRYLINDDKPEGTESAFAINLKRNEGINNIDI